METFSLFCIPRKRHLRQYVATGCLVAPHFLNMLHLHLCREIYPEMPVAALTTVPRDVAEEVQHALMAFRSHVDAYEEVQAGKPWDPKRCDTTPELAELAEKAALAGHIHGFRNPR